MIDEMTSLHSNGTTDVVQLPPGKKPYIVGFRWIFIPKVGADGKIDRLKVCLVAKVYTQLFGLEYSDTFSLVAKMTSTYMIIYSSNP